MQRERLTLERIKRFSCPDGKQQGFLWDTVMPRLAVRATATGAKAFIFEAKLKRKTIRTTIGDATVWILDDARAEAYRLQTMVDAGRDPRQVKAEITAADESARVATAAAKKAKELEAKRLQLTLGEAWAVYCEARRPKWGERTAHDHEKLMQPEHTKSNGRKMKAGVLASLAPMALSEINATKVAEWLDAETTKRPTQAALGYRLLRAFLNWCAEHPDYSSIAAPDACTRRVSKEHLPKSKAKDDALQREQLRIWFDCVRRIPNRTISAYLQILLLVGCRREELATLQWENVDFQWNSLTIRDKVEGERTIPMTPYVRSLLLELKVRNETKPAPTRILRGKRIPNDLNKWNPSQWVFVAARRTNGNEFNRMTEPSIAHRKALAAAGLPPVSLHGLRRSFGSLSEWVQVPVGVVAQIQGHKPSATAEKYYRVRPLDLLREWHASLEAWILEQAGLVQPKTAPSLSVVQDAAI